jgi:adenosylhomocysteinase
VYDINPIRRVEAYNRLCDVPTKEYIMKSSDIIFCATGGHALDVIDFRQLKNGCFVFSVTSSDDEFNLTYLNSEYEKEDLDHHITKYYNALRGRDLATIGGTSIVSGKRRSV